MKQSTIDALIEGAKEIVRNTLMAVIPVVLSGLDLKSGQIGINWPVVYVTALYTAITGLDRFLHIKGKEDAPKVEQGQSFGLIKL